MDITLLPQMNSWSSYLNKSVLMDYYHAFHEKRNRISPLQFLIETRPTLAKKLLCDQDYNSLNISEIAGMCGFDDPLYFSRIFKKHYDVSPKEFLIAKSDKAKRM